MSGLDCSNTILPYRTKPDLHILTIRYISPAPLGALPPPHLLTSVPLSGGEGVDQQSFPTPVGATSHSNITPPATGVGLILSPAADPIPQKLVTKVRSGQFVEMREFLADNIALLHQLESIQGTAPVAHIGPSRPRLREVSTLSTWTYCFLGYMAVLTSDDKTRTQLAYARTIIREAQRHGGTGWLDYDRTFRQQAASDVSLQWNHLSPSLHASTILGQPTSNQRPVFCTFCRGTDHFQQQCALAYLYPQPTRQPIRPTINRPGRRDICKSWNKGACMFPGYCFYKHICFTCQADHRARDCPRTPEDSFYKQRKPPQPPSTQPSPPTQRMNIPKQ